MTYFRKSVCRCLGWLVASELLCLVLAFSFAILPIRVSSGASLICCLLIHILLMANTAASIASTDIRASRRNQHKVCLAKPILLGLITAMPRFGLYGILWNFSDSKLMLNLFLLLNAPYIQIHKLLLNGAEPFFAVSGGRKVLMGLLPLVTWFLIIFGYLFRILRAKNEKSGCL